ncbi:MAG: Maf family protein [Deltaproteobacteria bacterium]|nr:Maf family protein [Deltaproteobacteria bacterium]
MNAPHFPSISDTYPLILASASPRRKRLMAQARIPHRVVVSGVEETDMDGDPATQACGLAEKKARRAFSFIGASWVLGADTMVVVENRILGKPGDAADAQAMLTQLGGRSHQVITGFCILTPSGDGEHCEAVTTDVRFKSLTSQEIDAYTATGEPEGKAGGYAIQGMGAFMVEAIFGSYTNVVGLPLCAVIKALIEAGALDHYPIP